MQEMPRSAWTSHPRPTSDLIRMVPARVLGFAVHWPGTTTPHAPTSRAGVASWLEAERHDHVDVRGWTDIAYAAAVDLAGRVWDLRGLPYQVAANGGSAELNRIWSAVTLILGNQDPPSPAMITALQQWRVERFLPAFPRARRVVAHRDLWPTECPGRAAYRLVGAGVFEQLPKDEDMFVTFNGPGERPHEGQWVPAGAGRRCISRAELDARISAGERVVSRELPGDDPFWALPDVAAGPAPTKEDEDMFVTFNGPGERPHEGQWVPAGAGRRCISRPELDARTSAGERVVSRELPGDDPFWALPDVAASPA